MWVVKREGENRKHKTLSGCETMAAAANIATQQSRYGAKVHPGDVGTDIGGSQKYVEEDETSIAAKQSLRATASASLGDEDRPIFVTDSTVMDPRSWYIRKWEYWTLVLLLWTATVTPFEVGFLSTTVNGLFWCNRVIDVCFFKDLVMNFNLGYFERTGARTLITDRYQIAMNYLSGWFTIDLISIIPFELMGELINNSALSHLKVLRIFRLFRLFKLIKILRSAPILSRWQSRVGIKYSVMSLAKYMVMIVFVAHWMACFWHVVTRLEDEDAYTWVKAAFKVGQNVTETGYTEYSTVADIPHSYVYCASLYHATMTLTTIGYGDIIATTDTERWFSVALQLVGASLYAYIVGVASGIVASMNKEKMYFQETMDELNDFMEDQGLSNELTVRLREFFNHSREMEKLRVYNNLLSRMSPGLRGEVAVLAYGKMLEEVPYFQDMGENFITAIAVKLNATALSPGEMVTAGGVPADTMYFVAHGIVSSHGLMASIGYHFGEEVILASGSQRFPVRAVTFCSLHTLSREAIAEVLIDFPKAAAKIRKAAIRMAFRRDVVNTVKKLTAGETATNGRKDSTGSKDFSVVAMQSLESMQKLQAKLMEKDEQLKKLLEDSMALQSDLQQQVPMLESHLQHLNRLKTKSDKDRSAIEKEQLTECFEAARNVIKMQEKLSTQSANDVKDAQYKFWKARQLLIRNAMTSGL